MDIIQRPRQTGKTSELLLRMLTNPDAVLLCHSHARKRDLETRYPLLKGRFFAWDEWTDARQRRCELRTVTVFIDDVEFFLKQHFGTNIAAVTMSTEQSCSTRTKA